MAADDEDLAYIHDQGYSQIAEGAAASVLELLAPRASIVELGCGSGVTAQRGLQLPVRRGQHARGAAVPRRAHPRRAAPPITSFRERGASYRRSEEVHRQRLHRPGEILALLRAAGFRARTRRRYGEVSPGSGRHVYVARKPR